MKMEMMNRMAHLTPVRTYGSAVASGVAIETEFQILNTLLAEKAAQLAVTEGIGSQTLRREIERQLARVVLERDDVLEVVDGELAS